MAIKPDDILDFWYSSAMKSRWFNSTPELDEQIRNNYEAIWEQARDGELDHWQETAEGCLALAIVLDQLPLNMFRGDAKSFCTEAKAIEVSHAAINKGLDKEIEKECVAFLYMPLMHSEDMGDQNLSVELFQTAELEHNARFARHHRDIVKRFGRFPHRNALLGRETTSEEIEYLNSKEAFTG